MACLVAPVRVHCPREQIDLTATGETMSVPLILTREHVQRGSSLGDEIGRSVATNIIYTVEPGLDSHNSLCTFRSARTDHGIDRER